MRALIAWIGARIIDGLIWLFGRTHKRGDVQWLVGPIGGDVIGDTPYQETAALEGLTIERASKTGGLVPDFEQLRSDTFDPTKVHPVVRDFYEHTTNWAMDVWAKTYFPTNIALFLLVTTISRQVNQLNFPLSPLDTALGMTSEIINLRRPDGSVRYTGWFRTLESQQRVLYTGFYMVERTPHELGPCVKVVFPMPNGNATVILRASIEPDGGLILDSSGHRFGDAGFYRVAARGPDRIHAWRVHTLKERFRVYVDTRGVLRCDHVVTFLGMPVLRLHYKMAVRQPATLAA